MRGGPARRFVEFTLPTQVARATRPPTARPQSARW